MNKITFKNSITGETATVKAGFSWILFFFSSFFGIPLFLRKLYLLGVIMLILGAINITLTAVFTEFYYYSALDFLMIVQFGMFGLNIFLGIKGNKMTALNYIKLGYKIIDKEDYKINMAKESWNLPDTAFEKIG